MSTASDHMAPSCKTCGAEDPTGTCCRTSEGQCIGCVPTDGPCRNQYADEPCRKINYVKVPAPAVKINYVHRARLERTLQRSEQRLVATAVGHVAYSVKQQPWQYGA